MRKHRKKKKSYEESPLVELNVMPFIDIFSLLCTFLLFSAVFVSMGIHTVQVPFFTNAAKEEDDNKPKRVLELKVEVEEKTLHLITSWSEEPVDSNKKTFTHDRDGIRDLHQELVSLKVAHTKADKVTVMVDEKVLYDQLSKVLDSITLLSADDPQITTGENEEEDSHKNIYLFPKVILGNVIL